MNEEYIEMMISLEKAEERKNIKETKLKNCDDCGKDMQNCCCVSHPNTCQERMKRFIVKQPDFKNESDG